MFSSVVALVVPVFGWKRILLIRAAFLGFALIVSFPNFRSMIEILNDSGIMLANRSMWEAPLFLEYWSKAYLYGSIIGLAYLFAISQIYIAYRIFRKSNRLIY